MGPRSRRGLGYRYLPAGPPEEARVSDLTVALIVFASTVVATVLGFLLQRRLLTGEQSDSTRTSVRLAIGLMSTLTAVVLGMVTASAKEIYDDATDVVTGMAVDFLTLDRILDGYGPESAEVRDLIKRGVRERIDLLQSGSRSFSEELAATGPGTSIEGIQFAVNALQPVTDHQREMRDLALQVITGGLSYGSGNLSQQRWFFAVTPTAVPTVFLVVVFLWLVLEFFGLGLTCSRDPLVFTLLVISMLVVSSAIFLLLELEDPLGGYLRVTVEPLRVAEEYLNR